MISTRYNIGETGLMRKATIQKLISRINEELESIELQPLQFFDGGWRFYVDASEIDAVYEELENNLENVPSLRRFMRNAVYDYDSVGFYYWLPYAQPPRGVMTPAMRAMYLK